MGSSSPLARPSLPGANVCLLSRALPAAHPAFISFADRAAMDLVGNTDHRHPRAHVAFDLDLACGAMTVSCAGVAMGALARRATWVAVLLAAAVPLGGPGAPAWP